MCLPRKAQTGPSAPDSGEKTLLSIRSTDGEQVLAEEAGAALSDVTIRRLARF